MKSKNLHVDVQLECLRCKVSFVAYRTRDYCSTHCAASRPCSDKTKRALSKQRKAAFARGVISVTGGRTKWLSYKDIKVQGTFELRTCAILDEFLRRGIITGWEYTNDSIQYIGDDKTLHTYLLDFKITRDNAVTYIETKGYITHKDMLKWNAASSQHVDLVVWLLEDILYFEKLLSL